MDEGCRRGFDSTRVKGFREGGGGASVVEKECKGKNRHVPMEGVTKRKARSVGHTSGQMQGFEEGRRFLDSRFPYTRTQERTVNGFPKGRGRKRMSEEEGKIWSQRRGD